MLQATCPVAMGVATAGRLATMSPALAAILTRRRHPPCSLQVHAMTLQVTTLPAMWQRPVAQEAIMLQASCPVAMGVATARRLVSMSPAPASTMTRPPCSRTMSFGDATMSLCTRACAMGLKANALTGVTASHGQKGATLAQQTRHPTQRCPSMDAIMQCRMGAPVPEARRAARQLGIHGQRGAYHARQPPVPPVLTLRFLARGSNNQCLCPGCS